MKHFKIDMSWRFSADPFPAYRTAMSYGRNQKAAAFLGVNGLTPNAEGVLPENGFKVIRSGGTLVAVAGEDTTNRALVMVGAAGGFRGSVEVFADATTGNILMTAQAANACDSGIEVVAILEVGQSVGFYSTGRRNDDVIVHTFDGSAVETKVWSRLDWDRRNDPPRSEENIRWVEGTFTVLSLSGNSVTEGVTLKDGALWGNSRIAHGFNVAPAGEVVLTVARVGRDIHDELVIAPATDGATPDPDRVLVLAHEFSPGCGAKRWPSFHIDWSQTGPIERLGDGGRRGGSGSDLYTLVIAPTDWAANIAAQFVYVRDYPSQVVAYQPGWQRPASDITEDLQLAFGGDEVRARAFVAKVAALPAEKLDRHTVCVCGRAAVKAHLETISGDPDFFLGADPNRVKGYVAEVHFGNGTTAPASATPERAAVQATHIDDTRPVNLDEIDLSGLFGGSGTVR